MTVLTEKENDLEDVVNAVVISIVSFANRDVVEHWDVVGSCEKT